METNRATGLKDFKDLKLIGKGSFGRVFRAVRPSDNQEYAIKEVNIKAMSQREREDAVNEVRMTFRKAMPTRQRTRRRDAPHSEHRTAPPLGFCLVLVRGTLDHGCTKMQCMTGQRDSMPLSLERGSAFAATALPDEALSPSLSPSRSASSRLCTILS
jgi:serine/threonine protein kinase